jgi:Uri superfamily endonuclease
VTSPPARLLEAIAAALGGPVDFTDDATRLPRESGAYLLLAHLPSDTALEIPRFAGCALPAGWYLYAGSACGPGGIAARTGRHLRSGKSVRWHIDHLTNAANRLVAAEVPKLSECEIVAGLTRAPGIASPITGFGSSDCRICETHLLSFSASR